jgi:hypothetical protein
MTAVFMGMVGGSGPGEALGEAVVEAAVFELLTLDVLAVADEADSRLGRIPLFMA